MTIKVGIIGTGGMANAHADEFKRIRGVELTSCLDVVPGRAEQFAKKHGIAHAAKNIDQLLCQVDAVSIVTPDRFHSEPTIQALDAGKHVLCEKPLTVTLNEARKVAAAAKRASKKGVQHMVNFSYRRSAAFQKAIEVARSGKLGKLRHVHSFYFQEWLSGDAFGSHWTEEAWMWRLQTAAGSGGVLGDIGCHILDLTTAVAGEVKAIRCSLRTFAKTTKDGREVTELKGRKLDANDSAIIEIEFAGGALGVIQTTRWATGHRNHLRCEAHGTQGALRFDLDAGYDKLDLFQGKDPLKRAWRTQDLKSTPNNHERFIRAIKTGKADQPDIFRGAQVQAYLDACFRSAENGKWEGVASWLGSESKV